MITKKRIILTLTVVLMVFAMMPMAEGKAYASSGDPALNLGTDVLDQNVNTSTAQTVWYADKAWRVIGYDGKDGGAANKSGAVTLLAAGNLEQTLFDASGNLSNVYANSTLKTKIDTIAGSFSVGEQGAIVKKTLVHDNYNNSDTDCIAGDADIENVLLWPLSTKEANDVDEGIRRLDEGTDRNWAIDFWWLRSPGDDDDKSAIVRGDGPVNYNGYKVNESYGVRPAFDLNHESVLFTSAAESGKSSGAEGADALKAQFDQTNSGDEWKVTLQSGHADFQLSSCTPTESGVEVKYTGATVGTEDKPEYISAVITDKPITEGGAVIKYYGRIAAASEADGAVTINTAEKLGSGDTLYVFNEQYNSDKKTDYASALQKVTIPQLISYDVTFKVVNGSWNDGTTADKIVKLSRYDNEDKALALQSGDIPVVGDKPNKNYMAGNWNVTPSEETAITDNTTYIYTYAANEGHASMAMGSDALSKDAGKNGAQTVWYAGSAWRVIGYNGGGVASTEGDMTLLASDNLQTEVQFNAYDKLNNDYEGSNLKNVIDGLYKDRFSSGEKTAVNSRPLEVGEYTDSSPYSTGVSGTETSGYLWPLSTAEAWKLATNESSEWELLKASDCDYWWLRSPGDLDSRAAAVYREGFITYEGYFVYHAHGVRPAFNLNLKSVLFTSAAEGGKSSGAEGVLNEVGTNSTNEWKLTLLDDGTITGLDGHKDFKISSDGITYDWEAGTVTVPYSGAATGDNEYISAIITDKPITEAGAKITYYGRIAPASAEEDASVPIKTAGKFRANDHLYVFNEQYNGEKKTDYASTLQEVNANETEVQGVISWNGDEQTDRPEKVVLHLLADENEIASKSVGSGKSGLWEFSFNEVPVYDTQGNKISYSINVDEIWNNDGTRKYTTDVEKPGDYHFLIINTLEEKPKLTITAKDLTYEYNGQIQGPGDTAYKDPAEIAEKVTVEGLQAGDELTSIEVDGQGTDVGKYDLVPSNATINGKPASDKYDITYVPGKLTINPPKVSYDVTFRVVNGAWNDGSADEKTVTLTGYEGDTLKLAAKDIPEAGDKPSDTYKTGSWDVTPNTETAITSDTTYTYSYAKKDSISAKVTFKVKNGSWNDGSADEKTVTLTGYEGDTLKLAAKYIPEAGDKPSDTYKTGSWDVTPNTETAITSDTTYTYTYAKKDSISVKVIFKVKNGSWNDGTTNDKTVTLTGYEGDTLKLAAKDIPEAGDKPNDTYKTGSWDVTPNTETAITSDTTYTYSYVKKDSISAKVTFKVENGAWNDGSADDKTVTLTGYEGDTLKLAAADIPEAGNKPDDTFKSGSWDTEPSTETAIVGDTTYIYTYEKDNTPVYYTVSFVDGQGNMLETQKVESGKAATAPADPKRSGYTFTGWDKDFSKVTGDITVTAQWEKNAEPAPVKKISGTLLSKMTAKGKNSLVLTWSKVNGADGYDIFFNKCGKQSPKKIMTIKGNKTFKWTKKSLKTKRAYKAVVKAYVMNNGKKTYVRTSPMVHAYTSGATKNYTNPKSVKVKKMNVSLKTGKTYKIKAIIRKLKKDKKLMPSEHAPKLRYISSDKKIATVSKSGKIKARSKGNCKIYVYAVNGVYSSVNVTVR